MSIISDIYDKYKSHPTQFNGVIFKQNDFPDNPDDAGGFGQFIRQGMFANAVGTLEGKPEIKLTKGAQDEDLIKKEADDSKLTFKGQVNGLYFSLESAVTIIVTEANGHVHVEMSVAVIGNNSVVIEVLDWIGLKHMEYQFSISWNVSAWEIDESKNGDFELADTSTLKMQFARPGDNLWNISFEQTGDLIALGDIGKILNLESALGDFLPQSFQDSALGQLAVESLAVSIDTDENSFQNFSLKIALGQEWGLVPGLSVSGIVTEYILERDGNGELGLTAIFAGDISGFSFELTGRLNVEGPWEATLKDISVSDMFPIFLGGKGVTVADFFEGTLLTQEFTITLQISFEERSFDLSLDNGLVVRVGPENQDGAGNSNSLAISDLGFLFTPKANAPDDIDVTFVGQLSITLDGSENVVSLSAKIPENKLDDLAIAGSIVMSNGIPVGQFISFLSEKGFGVSLPSSLDEFAITEFGIGYSRTPQAGQTATSNPVLYDFALNFNCAGTMPLDGGLSLNPSIDFTYQKTDGNAAIEIKGRIDLELEAEDETGNPGQAIALELAFAKDVTEKSFAGSLFIPEDQPLSLKTLVGYFDSEVVEIDGFPDFSLPIPGFFVAYTKDDSGAAGKLMLGIRPLAGLQFSNLPMVGNVLPDDQEIGLSNLLFIYVNAEIEDAEVTDINALLPEELQIGGGGEEQIQFTKGLQISGSANLGLTSLSLYVPILGSNGSSSQSAAGNDASSGGSGSASSSSGAQVEAIGNDSPAKWFKVAKQLGPLYVSRVGFGFPESRLTLFLEVELAIGPLSLALYGFSIGSPLDTFAPVPGLEGFGLSYVKPPVEISAMFLKIGDDAPTRAPAGVIVSDRFAGTAVIKTSKLSISALGEYASTNLGPSFYLYAYIGYPLGGPAFFFVEGLALGFGFNRSVRLPKVSEINKHPFVAIAMEDDASLIELAEALISGNYIPITPESIFLAIGIRFTTFKILDSFALVVATFGNSFRLDLMGVSKLVLPPGSKETGAPPLAEITLNLSASFIPDEGFFGMSAELTRDSYILSRDCYLQGGFAFYSWFKGPHEGDFVLTLGGYHPRFSKPSHYPNVPRLGFNWQVSKEVSIKGRMYFALTPTCAMAGGRLEAVWKSGDLKAWFIIGADFLISWKPYFYDIELYLQFGVEYTFWFFGEQTLSIELGADLHIWGPEFSGIAKIDIEVTSFEVEFGAGASLDQDALSWREFRKSFLPESVLGMTIVDGLIKETDDGSWIVDPDKLVFEIESAVPNKFFKIENNLQYDESGKFGSDIIGAGPMLTNNLNSELNINLDELTVNPADASEDHFTVSRIEKSVPAAVWGVLNSTKPSVNPAKRLIPNVLSGIRFTVIPPTPPDAIANINGDFLAFNEDDHQTDNNWQTLSNFSKGDTASSVYEELLAEFAKAEAMPSPIEQLTENELSSLDLTVESAELPIGAY